MKARWCVLLVVAISIAVTSCGDGGPILPAHDKGWLVQFKRVTLAEDAPDRLEIEIVVRTGPNFSEPAPDGTKIAIETSLGEFAGNGRQIEASTIGGHALITLVPPRGPAHMEVAARVEDVEAQLEIAVDEYGSMRLGS